MKNKYQKLTLLLITSFILFTRFYKISSLPPLNRDEAAIGYNAYSILTTSFDEHGQKLPLSFKSFGDFKMPGYIYLTILPAAIFGLNEFSVRFWSLFGSITAIFGFYWLAKWIFKQFFRNASAKNTGCYKTLALASTLLLAINPWHIFYSRVGFEANLNLTFSIWGLVFLFYGFKKKFLLPISSLCFVLMFYTYSSSFIFLPPFLLLTAIIFRKELLQNTAQRHPELVSGSEGLRFRNKFGMTKKVFFWQSLALIIFILGATHATWSLWQVSSAKQNITIFSDPGIIDSFNKLWSQSFVQNPLFTKLWYNKYFFFLRIIFKNYLLTFSPNFLFFAGGNHPWQKIPGIGYFYILDGLFIILGLLFLLTPGFPTPGVRLRLPVPWRSFTGRRTPGVKIDVTKIKWFILGWLLLSPIPSAITIDAPHATRSLQLLPVLLILAGLGLSRLAHFAKAGSLYKLIFSLYLLNFLHFSYLYFVSYPKNLPPSLLPGLKQVFLKIKEKKEQRIVFAQPAEAAYIYTAFYTKYDPEKFQKEVQWSSADPAGMIHATQFGRFYFDELLMPENQPATYLIQEKKGSLNMPQDAETIKNEYGEILWRIYRK